MSTYFSCLAIYCNWRHWPYMVTSHRSKVVPRKITFENELELLTVKMICSSTEKNKLLILLISSAYPNSHIFVKLKRVWLFGYVWLFGMWLFGYVWLFGMWPFWYVWLFGVWLFGYVWLCGCDYLEALQYLSSKSYGIKDQKLNLGSILRVTPEKIFYFIYRKSF